MYPFYKQFSLSYSFNIFQISVSWVFAFVGFGVASRDFRFSLLNSFLEYLLNLIGAKHQARP